MQIKKVFLALLLGFSFNILAYANNNCPRWFPLPALDGLAIVMPIYDASIIEADLDCDGVIDTLDNDIDGDGVLNINDAFPLNSSESVDTDGDGIGNNADSDDDNDGYSDRYEIIAGSDLLNVADVPNPNRPMSMWAIGDSTVAEYNDMHRKNGELDHRGGWAEMIWKFTKSGQHVYDYARAVASSKSFYETFNGYDTKNFWEKQPNNNKIGAKESLQTFISPGNGAFLFIQFGHNDGKFGNENVKTYANFEPGQYADYLTKYVREAKKLGAIPVLVTPVTYIRVSNDDENLHQYVGMDGNGGMGDYPQIMKEVASRENVLLLDLTQKSYDYFREHFEDDETILEAYGSDYVHTNLEGATQVAKLIKGLACEYQGINQLDANLLCAQFKVIDLDEVTVHEDAEDGNTEGWALYATTAGSTITNVEDTGSQVIELNGLNGTANGFSFSGLNITSGFVASWRLKYTENFQFFVQVRSINSPDSNIYMEYTPDDISTGLDGVYIRNGLGVDAKDGTWHTFTRDVDADFNVIYPDDTITRIVGFSIRGSGRIDDISTSTRAATETFAHNGHNYKIVKIALSWQDASAAAQADGGYLANIGSITENHEIYSRLNRYINQNEYINTDTTLSNGGGASYVWIGANDLDGDATLNEGKWIWENNQQQFWQGIVSGNVVGGLYSNWGRNKDTEQKEPDNASNSQDAAAIALTDWKLNVGHLGQASQWNDLRADTELYYIVEYDNQQEIVLNELKAFPTAEGAGAAASGGRGGEVVYVTNRDADGNGSLKWALTREFNRTIVFAIGGRFDLSEGISLGNRDDSENENVYNNFTLAGQTAWDKGGVHLANNGDISSGWAKHFNVYGQENMILRYFDTRFNWEWYVYATKQFKEPSIRFTNSSNLIVDHMTSGWSSYGIIITTSNKNSDDRTLDHITVQRSLFHENIIDPEALTKKNPTDENPNKLRTQTNHNVALLLGIAQPNESFNDWNTKVGRFSIHKNAFIGISHRYPNIAGGDATKLDFINNYVHGFDGGKHDRLVRAAGDAHNDFINNSYQKTEYSPPFSADNLIAFTYDEFLPLGYNVDNIIPNFYISGNLFLSNNGQRLDITDTIEDSNGRNMLHVWTPTDKSHFPNLILRDTPNSSPQIPVSILNANEVKDNVLSNVGGNVRFSNDGSTTIDNIIDAEYIRWAKENDAPSTITSVSDDCTVANLHDCGIGNETRFVHPAYDTDLAVDLNITDTDRDGIPNEWELAHSLDINEKNNASVRTNRTWNIGSYRVINNAGYTDLEMYLADIAGDFHMLANKK